MNWMFVIPCKTDWNPNEKVRIYKNAFEIVILKKYLV